LKEDKTPEQVIETSTSVACSRPPTEKELAKLEEFFTAEAKPEPVLNDIFWSLLNAKEFVFNIEEHCAHRNSLVRTRSTSCMESRL